MRIFGWIILAIILMVGLFVGTQVLWFGGEAVNSAHGVVHKTLDPDHVIFDYEYFHNSCHSVLAFNEQIKTAAATLAADQSDVTPDPLGQRAGIVARDRTNLEALRNQRDTAAQAYNAKSHELNNSIFKSHSLPASIDPPDYVVECES